MKKILVLVLGLLFLSFPKVYCATQYNALGNVSISTSTVTGSLSLMMLPKASIAVLIPATTGQVILCSNCTDGNNGKYNICYSTGSSAAGQFVMVSTAVAILGCR